MASDIGRSYHSLYCEIFVYPDTVTAQDMLTLACAGQSLPPFEVGQESCIQADEGLKVLYFRRDEVIVTLTEDSGGFQIRPLAEIMDGRLNQ